MGYVIDLDKDRYALDKIMSIDHVIKVWADGTVTDAPDYIAPSILDGELDTSAWSLMGGYTGQQGGGDTMHNSEFIGGRMARDILSTPGIYVAVVCLWTATCDDPDTDCPCENCEDNEPETEGWAVARIIDND